MPLGFAPLGSTPLGASADGSGAPVVIESSITSVTVSPATVTLAHDQGQTFTAQVEGTGTIDYSVTWNTDTGTITSAGDLELPPSPVERIVIVTATSEQDPTKYGTATVTQLATPLAITDVVVTPGNVTLADGQTQDFDAAVYGTGDFDPAVTWETPYGTINSSGTLSLPSTTVERTFEITARSVQDPEQFGTAAVTQLAVVLEPPPDEDPVLRKVSIQLGELGPDGVGRPAANLTGVRVSFAAGTGPHDAGPYLYQSGVETTDANGWLLFNLPEEAIAAGATGVLSILMPDGSHNLAVVPVA